MKHVFSFFFFALLLTLQSFAQSTFQGGLVLGGNTSQIDGDGVSGYYRGGLSVGVFGQYKPVERLAFNMELLYDQLGSNNRGVRILAVDYASVALTAGAIVPVHLGSDEHQVMFHAGVVPGYLLRAVDLYDLDFSQYLHRTDLRVLGGIEYKVGNRFAFTIRHGRSLLPFANKVKGLIYYTEQLGPWHRYWQASLRIYFGQ